MACTWECTPSIGGGRWEVAGRAANYWSIAIPLPYHTIPYCLSHCAASCAPTKQTCLYKGNAKGKKKLLYYAAGVLFVIVQRTDHRPPIALAADGDDKQRVAVSVVKTGN